MSERTIKKKFLLWASSLIVLLLVAGTLGLLFMQTDFFADRAADILESYYFRGTNYRLELGSIRGNPLGRIDIQDIIIRYCSDDFSYDVIRIEEINCRYDLISLVGSNHRLDELFFIAPHVWIKSTPSGINRLPQSGGSLEMLYRFSVEKLGVSRGQIIYQGVSKAEAVKNINLAASLSAESKGIYCHMESGSCDFATRKISINEIKGDVVKKFDKESARGNIFLENCSVRTDNSKLILNGSVNPELMSANLRVKAAPFDLKEAAYILDYTTGEKGKLNGVYDIQGGKDTLNVKGITDGVIGGFALENFIIDMTAENSKIRINNFRGKLNGAFVDGDGDYLFEGKRLLSISLRAEKLDLSKGFIPRRGLPETDFTGKMGIKYYPLSSEMEFQLDLERGHFRRFPYEQAIVNGFYGSDTLFLERVSMESPTHTVDINGSITVKDEINLFVNVQCESADTLFPYFNIEEYRAGIDVNGLWSGTLSDWDLRVSGNCDNFEYRKVLVPEGQLKLAIEKDKRYSIFMDISGDSCYIQPFGFSGIDLSLDYSRGKTNIKRLDLQRPSFKATMWGEILKNRDVTEFVFSDVLIEVLGENWKSNGNFNVLISDSTIFFNDMQLHSKLGALYFDGALNKVENTLLGEFDFDRLDVSLLNRAGVVSIPLQGKAGGTLNCSGDISDPSIKIDLDLTEGIIDTIAVSSLGINAFYEGGHFRIDTLSLSTTAGFGFASGTMDGVHWKDINKDMEKAFRNAVVDLDIYSSSLEMKPFAEYFGNLPSLDGLFTGRLALTDSLAHPKMDIYGIMNDFTLKHVSIPRIDLHASTSGDKVNFDGKISLSPSENGKFAGFLPIQKNEWFYSINGDRPIYFNLELPDIDLGHVKKITDLVAEADGRGSLQFSIDGSVNNPDLSGRIDMYNAGFRPNGMEEKFRDVNSYISLEDSIIHIHSLSGKEGKDGKFNCLGSIVMREWKPVNYNLSLELDRVLIASIKDVLAIVTGKVSVGTQRVDGKVIPALIGDLKVNKIDLYYDLGELGDAENGTVMGIPSWVAEVNLDMEGEARIRTSDANVELLGDVVLYHNRKGTYLRGTLNLHRGWYNIYNNKFRVNSGTLVFTHAGGSRPIVNIEAETFDPEGKRIYLTILWDENDPQPRLSLHHEESGYSETDIWKMLGGGIVGTQDGDETGWDALGAMQNLATNYFENILNSQMEGFTVSLEQSSQAQNSGSMAGEKETMLAVGKYLSQGLYVRYKQGLSVFNERNFEIEYRISNLFIIRSEYIHSEKVLLGENRRNSDEVNFDVKIRWEF